MGAARRWQRALANGYRNWRYGTRETPSSRLGVALAYLFPGLRTVLDLEFRHLPRPWAGARVLDIGAGDGTFLSWAAAAGWLAVGVDPDARAVATARRRGLDVRQGTADDVHGETSSFDVVTLSHVIEHVHHPRELLLRIRDLLKPAGLLWLDTPDLSSPGHRAFGRAWLGLDPPRHLVLFHEQALRDLLESVGFTVIRRVPRPDVPRLTYGASERIARGHHDPLHGEITSLALRLRIHAAAWRARIKPQDSDFITLLARKTSPC